MRKALSLTQGMHATSGPELQVCAVVTRCSLRMEHGAVIVRKLTLKVCSAT
jgi:hypothetical protein